MATYRVVVPMIVVDIAGSSGVGRRELYLNNEFDSANVTAEHLEHLVSGGFVVEVERVDLDAAIAESAAAGDVARGDAPATGDGPDAGEPARNASRDEWAAYALTKGATEESVADLKRDELVEKFGAPPA